MRTTPSPASSLPHLRNPPHEDLLARRRFRRRLLWRTLGVQSFILDQSLAHVQEPDRFILKRRTTRIVAKVDVGSLIDRIEGAQSPRQAAAIQTGDIDAVLQTIVGEKPETVAQRRGSEQRYHQIRPRMHAPLGQRGSKAGGSA